MHLFRFASFLALGLIASSGLKAESPKLDKPTLPQTNPLNTPMPVVPAPVMKDRDTGTVTIKPLVVNFSGITVGMKHKSQLINERTIDPFQSSMGRFTNQAQAFGRSYDLEIGVMLSKNIEAFIIAGLEYQRGFAKISISNFNQAAFDPNNVFFYKFQSRTNYAFSLGGRYYWNTQKPWFPFVGVMGTVIRQGPIRANASRDLGFPVPNIVPIGFYTFQDRKTLLGGTLQVGVDYQFTDLISLTFTTGVQYTQRARKTYGTFEGKTMVCSDYRNFWSFPFMAALKFTI